MGERLRGPLKMDWNCSRTVLFFFTNFKRRCLNPCKLAPDCCLNYFLGPCSCELNIF